ncbi:MAG: twin-arginine translocation signal domain-containing protein, partial [Psychrobacter sp.]
MGIKTQSWDDDKDNHATKTISRLNRRQFLRQIGVSTGTAVLAGQGISQAFAASPVESGNSSQLTKDDLPTSLLESQSSLQTSQKSLTQSSCIKPTIKTRLFASSNVGGSEDRNQLALDRVACAGFKVENPT